MAPLAAIAATFAALVDVLLPGDEDFPSAATAGIQAVVLDRLRTRIGWEGIEEIAAILSADRLFIGLAPDDQIARVAALESDQPVFFSQLRFVAYLAYYESPAVIRVLQKLGHDYNDAPLPLGYTMDPFDPRPGHDLPSQPKGTYVRTEAILRVDLSSLADLELPRVQE